MTEISKEQYEKLIANQCSEEEALLIISYLKNNPDVLEDLLQAGNWERFEEHVHLHPVLRERMYNRFMQHLAKHRQQKRLLSWIAVAASVLLIVMVIQTGNGSKKTYAEVLEPVQKNLPVISWQEIKNYTDTIRLIELKDHSLVKLYPQSTIRFRDVFDSSRRDIFLAGTAQFHVAKDKQRPFTVYGEGVAVTALGTVFRVIAKPGIRKTTVTLYEGKVKVCPADSTLLSKTIYLVPGQKLSMDAGGNADLSVFAGKKNTGHTTTPLQPVAKDSLTFNNLSLEQVVEQLKERFGVDIYYNEADIKTVFITAAFNRQDTLPDILNILCTLNNLRLEKAGNGYIITR